MTTYVKIKNLDEEAHKKLVGKFFLWRILFVAMLLHQLYKLCSRWKNIAEQPRSPDNRETLDEVKHYMNILITKSIQNYYDN